MQQKEKSISFWDNYFKTIIPYKIEKKDVTIDNALDGFLKKIGDQCETVYDIGCGIGTCLIKAYCLGDEIKQGIGIDASKHAVLAATEIAKLSNFDHLTFLEGDESYLKSIETESVDGIICSNFLDVVTKPISDVIIQEINRIIKPHGLFLLKLNFFLDEEKINKLNMEKIDENTYAMDGVIRAYNLSTQMWLNRLDQFILLEEGSFQRAPNLPYDRILFLRKR